MVAFELDVFSEPRAALDFGNSVAGERVRQLVEYDSNLIKPALLFSSKVNLHTFREDMRLYHVGRMIENSSMPLRMFLYYVEFIRRGDWEEFRRVGITSGEVMTNAEIQGVDEARARRHENLSLFQDLFLELIDKYRSAVIKVSNYRTERLSETLELLDTRSLEPAIDAGILEVSSWNLETSPIRISGMPEEIFFDRSLVDLVARIVDSARAVMLDPGAGDLIVDMLGESPSDELRNTQRIIGADVQIARTVCGYLPALSHLTIREVVDLRSSLDQYLPAFRQEMARIADEVNADNSNAADVVKEVEQRWTREIDPILADIRHKVAVDSYPRHLLRALATQKDVIVSTASSVVLAAGSFAAGIATLLPALAAASYPAIKAANELLASRDEMRQNRLYFLHAARERVEQKGARRRRS